MALHKLNNELNLIYSTSTFPYFLLFPVRSACFIINMILVGMQSSALNSLDGFNFMCCGGSCNYVVFRFCFQGMCFVVSGFSQAETSGVEN